MDSKDLYFDLMKRCLVNWFYGDRDYTFVSSNDFFKNKVIRYFQSRGIYLMRRYPFDPALRSVGGDSHHVYYAHSMIGLKRLNNLQFCVESVIKNRVPGDLIETGVWRGGACIFMKAILKAYNDTERNVWVADSFEGLPKPNEEKYPADKGDVFYTAKELAIPMEEVRKNFQKYDLLDDRVKFLKGWFKDTLPTAPITKLAVARLDGDMYESTMDALVNLYPKVSSGGYVIIDDYEVVSGCKKAVHDFRSAHGINEEIKDIDGFGVFWQVK